MPTQTQRDIKDFLKKNTKTLDSGTPPDFDLCCPDLKYFATEDPTSVMNYVLQCNKIDPTILEGAALPSAFRQNKKQGRAAFEFKVYDQCKGPTICGESPGEITWTTTKQERCYICGFPINEKGGDYVDAPRGRQCEHVLTVLTIALLCGLSNEKYTRWVNYNDTQLTGLAIWEKFKLFRQQLIHGVDSDSNAKNNEFAWKTGVAGKSGQAYKWSHPACNLIKNEYPFLTVLFHPVKGPYIHTPGKLENSIIFVLKELLFSFRDDAMNWRKSREAIWEGKRALDLMPWANEPVFLVDDKVVGYQANNPIVSESRSKSKGLPRNLFPNVALTPQGDIPLPAIGYILERYNHIRKYTIKPIYDVLNNHWSNLSYYSAFANTMLLSIMKERYSGYTDVVDFFSRYLSSSKDSLQRYMCSSDQNEKQAFQTAKSLVGSVLRELRTYIPQRCPGWMISSTGGGKREKRKKSSIYRRRRKNKKKIYRSGGVPGGQAIKRRWVGGASGDLYQQYDLVGKLAWRAAEYVADPTALQPYESDGVIAEPPRTKDGSEPDDCDLTDWQSSKAIAKATALVATDMIDYFTPHGHDWLQSVIQLDASCAAGVTSGSEEFLQPTTSLAEIDRQQQELDLAGEWQWQGHAPPLVYSSSSSGRRAISPPRVRRGESPRRERERDIEREREREREEEEECYIWKHYKYLKHVVKEELGSDFLTCDNVMVAVQWLAREWLPGLSRGERREWEPDIEGLKDVAEEGWLGGGGGKKSRRKYNKKKRTRRKYRNKVNKSKQKKSKQKKTRRTRRTRRRNTKK